MNCNQTLEIMKYKIGDKVEIIGHYTHGFNIGDVGVIVEWCSDNYHNVEVGNKTYYVLEKDMKKTNTMTKSELKTGMLVELRDGGVRKLFLGSCVGDVWVSKDGAWIPLENVKNDLTHKGDCCFDIMKVYSHNHPDQFPNWEPQPDHLVWQREPKIELTLTVNGKETDPREISKETWDNFRK